MNQKYQELLDPEVWGWLHATAFMRSAEVHNPVKAAEQAIIAYAECFPESIGLQYWGDVPSDGTEASKPSDPMGSPVLVHLACKLHGSMPAPSLWEEANYPDEYPQWVDEDPIESTFALREALFGELGWVR